MAKRELPPLSEAQLEIVNVVWDNGEATVGQVWKELAKRRRVSRNTVSTMITRLKEKGWLRRRVSKGTHLYSSTQPREKVLPRFVRRFVDAAFQGSADGLVFALLESGHLSIEEIERIKVMLGKAEREIREEQR